MIEAIDLTSTRRSRGPEGGPVENVSFDVYPGQVTALLGAAGTGKSTVLRLMVELEAGGGRTLFGGRPYRALRPAVREVGLALNPDAVHPGRTVQAHLQLYSAGGGVPKARIAEVLEVAGLSTQATVRCGRLDPGQRQRLAIAAALLGDPAALILDEPRALDSHGMSWFHALIRAYAAQGRTVLVAATDPDTLAGTADHVVVLRRDERDGVSRVVASRSAAEVFDERRATVVQVRSPQAARLAAALESEGAALAPAGPGALQVRGLDRARIGEIAHVAGICLHELSEIGHDDDVFGLRPVPRQKELLPGLNRTAWRAGVRVVAKPVAAAEIAEIEDAEEIAEIAEAEVVEAQVPVAATHEEPVGAQAGGIGMSAEAQMLGATREELVGAQAGDAGMSAEPQMSGATREEPVGAQPDGAVATPQVSEDGAAVSEHVNRGIGVWPAQGSVAEPRETAADQPADDLSSTHVSEAGSWRLQRTAGSRWSAAQARKIAVLTDQPVPAAEEPASDSVEPPRRSSTLGLRWGRNRPSTSPEPPAAAAAAPAQPAVPFTVAPAGPTAEAADGMTPWRAVAARASQQPQSEPRNPTQSGPPQNPPEDGAQHQSPEHQSHQHQSPQQPPAAQAAPAEQDAST